MTKKKTLYRYCCILYAFNCFLVISYNQKNSELGQIINEVFFQYIAKLKMLASGIRLAPQGNIHRTQYNIGHSQNRKITNLSENI